MARAGAAAALVLSLGLRALAQEPVQGFADSVEREFAIRRWALAGGAAEAREASALGPDGRVSLLRALERRAQFVSFATSQENAVLAQLLGVESERAPDLLAAALRAELVADAESLRAAARHPLPAVRLAVLEAAPARLDAATLAELAQDSDERVASAALDRVASAELDERATLELAGLVLRDGDRSAGLALASRFARWKPAVGWLASLERSAHDAERKAIVAALDLRWGAQAGDARVVAERVAAVWPGPEGFEELFTAAARASHAPGSALGVALLARLGQEDELRALALLRGALEALPAAEVLAWMRAQPASRGALGGYLFEALALHATELAPVDLAPWLHVSVESELRREAVGLLRTLLVEERRAEFGALLVRALDDSDRGVSDDAFSALCAARPAEPWLEALYRRWRSVDARRAEALLAELPRGVRLGPFQGDLCGIASLGGAAGAAAFELLAPLAPDAGVANLARERLDVELAALERLGLRGTELRAAALVRALHEQAGPAAQDELERVLARTRERVEVSKVAVWALGQDVRGRERLAPWLAPGVPRRLRIEAALARAPHGDARAVEALRGDWPSCDFDLRARTLRALDANGAEAAIAWLRRVALDAGENELHRELALDLLAARRPPEVETLLSAATDRNLDLRRHALLALGACGDARAVAWLRTRRTERDEQIETPEVRTVRELEREAIWMALAAAQALDDGLVGEWLAAPLTAASEQVRARFRGRAQGGTEFSWRAELAMGEELARSGRLAAALEHAGAWWTCDARLLAALGERAAARGDLASARGLLGAAGVGLLGEAESEERDLRLFEVRCALLAACEAAGAVAEHEALVGRLAADERLGRGPHRAFERLFGAFDPVRGSDGLAWLEASAPLLRARVLLAAGEREGAQRALDEARERAGRSRAAAEACAEVAASLRR